MSKLGTCYETAFQALFDGQHDEWTLVHGRPTLTCEPFIEYGHAWLEDPDETAVYDSETKSYWPIAIYYKYGKIDPRKSHRYTKEQATKWAIQVNHYGPWEGPEAVGVWSKKAERAANRRRVKKVKVTGLGPPQQAFDNPTPMLRQLRREAEQAISKEGFKEARKAAWGTYFYALKQWGVNDKTTRHFGLLVRMMGRMKGKVRKKAVRKTMLEKLIDEYGTTSPMAARGFILDDGQCLNLGQYDDHRIICGVYPDSRKAEERYGSRYGAFKHLCQKFNMIRWIPESKMAEVFVPTTRQQDEALRDLADAGALKEVEVHRPRGGTVMLEAEDGETLVRGINAILG